MPMNIELDNDFKNILEFQQSEKWRKFGWESNEISHIDVHEVRDDAVHSAIPAVEKEMENRKYMVVQQYSEEIEPDGSMPINLFIVDGKDIKDTFHMGNASGLSDAYVYGPSMASEIDIGYNSGTNYIMDITHLSKRAQTVLLHNSENILEDVQERAVRSAEMGGYSSSYEEDSGYFDHKSNDYDLLSENESYRNEERALYGRALDDDEVAISVDGTVKTLIANAFDNGAESPYASIYDAFSKSLEKDSKEMEENKVVAEKEKPAKKATRTVEEIAKSIAEKSIVTKETKKEEKKVEKEEVKKESKYKRVAKESVKTTENKVVKAETVAKDDSKGKDAGKGKYKPVENKSRGNAMYRLSQGQRRLVMFLTGQARKNNWLDKNGNTLVFDQDAGDAKAELNRFIEGAKLNGFTFTPAINANRKRAQEKAKANNGTSDGR